MNKFWKILINIRQNIDEHLFFFENVNDIVVFFSNIEKKFRSVLNTLLNLRKNVVNDDVIQHCDFERRNWIRDVNLKYVCRETEYERWIEWKIKRYTDSSNKTVVFIERSIERSIKLSINELTTISDSNLFESMINSNFQRDSKSKSSNRVFTNIKTIFWCNAIVQLLQLLHIIASQHMITK